MRQQKYTAKKEKSKLFFPLLCGCVCRDSLLFVIALHFGKDVEVELSITFNPTKLAEDQATEPLRPNPQLTPFVSIDLAACPYL